MSRLIGRLSQLILALDKKIIWLSHNFAAILLAVAATLVFFQVFTRFVLGDSATWTEILARGIIIWLVFVGMAVTFRQGAMISITALARAIPGVVNHWLQRVVTLLILCFLGILVWYGTLMTEHVVNQKISMLEISYSWFYASMPIGAVCAVIAVLARHIELERSHKDLSGDTMEDGLNHSLKTSAGVEE